MRLVIDFEADELCTIEITEAEHKKLITALTGHPNLLNTAEKARRLANIAGDIQTQYGQYHKGMRIMGWAARVVES